MSTDTDKMRDDLAFMRGLVEGGGRTQWIGGAAFLSGGLLYALQCIVQWSQAKGYITMSGPLTLAFVMGITAAFVVAMCVIGFRGRHVAPVGAGNKAFQSIFGATGLATLALVATFAIAAVPRQSILIWELFPAALFVLQGTAWWAAYMIRRRAWLGVVAFGWWASAIAMAILLGTLDYILVAAFALIAFLAAPGAYMMHLARKPA